VGVLLRNVAQRPVFSVMLAVGVTLFGVGLLNLINGYIEKRSPELARRKNIEVNDERNAQIRLKAQAFAGNITRWLVMAMVYLLILAEAPLWAVLCAIGVFALYSVLYLLNSMWQQNRM
jgi:hypothetical protein